MDNYCYNCMKDVKPKIIEEEEEFIVREKKYKYLSKKSVCPFCNSELEVLDEDLARREDAFRKEEKLILNSEIEELLEKYKIGKKPLAKLLGWSEVTIIRYLNYDTPSKMYSDELYRLLNSSDYMKEILIKNRENISKKAFESSMKAIINKDNESEINLVANYIIERMDCSPLSLEKILYYCQGFYLAFFGEKMFKDNCQAWVHGPVYPNIYLKYKNFSYNTIYEETEYYVEEIIDEDKKKVIDAVINGFKYYGSKYLEYLTHNESPWKDARIGLKDNENSRRVINVDNIKSCFEKIIEKYKIDNIDQIGKYPKEKYLELLNKY